MPKKVNIVISVIFTLFIIYYVYPKSPEFPKTLPNSVQSFEPADVETPLRRGYYTNLNREEVISFYENEFNKDFKYYSPRLNYPPEEAQTIIRDQTKSTFLEEIVHPFRESLYINGFEPKTEEYKIIKDGVHWKQKIIVRYVDSSLYLRIIITILIGISLYLLLDTFKFKKRYEKK